MALIAALALISGLLAGGTAPARAQDSGDPPARVGRLSFIDGKVSFHDNQQDQWVPATLNWPVTSGQSYWVEPGGRAEIQIGDSEIRIEEGTQLDVVRLDDNSTVLSLPVGSMNLHMRQPAGDVEVQTSRAQVSLKGPGRIRLSSGRPGDGGGAGDEDSVAVFDGEAKIDDPRAPDVLRKGESATIGQDPGQFTIGQATPTPLDDWALAREASEPSPAAVAAAPPQPPAAAPPAVAAAPAPAAVPPGPVSSSPPVSPNMTGYQDLNANGSWQTVPSYGPIWYPSAVPAGWAPYRYGHWAFVRPWGWTWIDDAPWGFAPFHYGRWVLIDGIWAWVPGTVVARPVYAPALVAFIGGPRWGVSFTDFGSFGAVGWVPLAPYEVFRPCYPASVTYVRRVNITNVNTTVVNRITNVTVVNGGTVARFANRNAATVVPGSAFRGGASVHQTSLRLPHEQLAGAPVTSNIAHLPPTAAARAGIATPRSALHVPETNAQGQVVHGRTAFANTQPPTSARPQTHMPTTNMPTTNAPAAPAPTPPGARQSPNRPAAQAGQIASPPSAPSPQPGGGNRNAGRPGQSQAAAPAPQSVQPQPQARPQPQPQPQPHPQPQPQARPQAGPAPVVQRPPQPFHGGPMPQMRAQQASPAAPQGAPQHQHQAPQHHQRATDQKPSG